MKSFRKILSILMILVFSLLLISCGTKSDNKNNTGWIQENDNWYYYDSNGKHKTGWLNDNNKYYYLNSSGILQKGWIKDKGKDYYCDNSGVMQTGWQLINDRWYYLNSDGSMASNTFIDGYYLTFSGAMMEKGEDTNSSATYNSNTTYDSNEGYDSSTTDDTSTTYNSGNSTKYNDREIVYVTAKGKKYHRTPKCEKSKNVLSMTLKEAKRQGYKRCSSCW